MYIYFVYLIDLLYVYYMCNLCSEYLYLYVMLCYFMLCYGRLLCGVLSWISVPSLTLCCSVHLTNKILELELEDCRNICLVLQFIQWTTWGQYRLNKGFLLIYRLHDAVTSPSPVYRLFTLCQNLDYCERACPHWHCPHWWTVSYVKWISEKVFAAMQNIR